MGNLSYLDKLSNWFTKFKRYSVKYKNGAFHLYSLFNSPETMVESFDKMAFCKHNRLRKTLTSDSIFLKSKMFYGKLEDGLWLVISHLQFKKNVMMTNLYAKEVPIEYHFINIHIKNKLVVNKSLINGLLLKERTWSMFKAGNAISEYHFKNSDEKNITILFTSQWLEKQKENNPIFKGSSLINFFDSENTHLILDEENLIYDTFYDEMMSLADDGVDKNSDSIRDFTYKVLASFIERTNTEFISESHFKLNDKDRKNIQRAEQYLNDNIFGSFPGVEDVAAKIGISPTKLKSDFKSMHNKTLYQYYSSLQMKAAHQLLSENGCNVKETAKLFGYENASKFSARFKEEFDITPSALIK